MGNISTDQKLQLVQQIRAENQENRMKMRSRERMLYGMEHQTKNYQMEQELPLYHRGYYDMKRVNTPKELYAMEEQSGDIEGGSFSSFKLRLVLAVFLFAAFLILDSGSGKVAGISTAMLREEINKDFDTGLEEVVFDFENNFPYTLFIK